MIPLGENPAVLDPRGTLKKDQIAMLRAIDAAPAVRAFRGWRFGQKLHRDATVKPLLGYGLVRQEFRAGRSQLVLSGAGLLVVEQLAPPSAPLSSVRNRVQRDD